MKISNDERKFRMMKKISNDEDESKEIISSERQIRTLNPEMSWFDQDYIPWPLWLVHSTSFTPWFVQFYIPCHVATRDLPLRSSAATLHVVGPIAGLAAVVRATFSAVRVGPSGPPSRRRGPGRRPVGPGLLGSWRCSLSGRAHCGSSVLVVLPGPGPACQRFASPAAASSGSGSCRLSFRFASESFSHCRPVGRASLGRFVAARPAAPRP